MATTSSGYVFKEVTQQLTNGNSTIKNRAVLRYGDKVYFATNAGGYCYLVEVDKQGNSRSIQLFANDYDPTFGEDDIHGTPSIEWIEEGRKILAVGGAHGVYTPLKWAVIDIVNWTIVANGDFGSDRLTYPVLVRTADGKISMFVTWEDPSNNYKRKLRWYEFDPSNNTWSDPVIVVSSETKQIRYGGWNIDTGYFIFAIPVPGAYGPYVIIQFDTVNKKFYDMAGNELSLPIDHSGMSSVSDTATYYIIDGYIYTIDTNDGTEITLLKKDTSGNIVKSNTIASQDNGLNTSYLYVASKLLYYDNKLLVGYRSNDNKFTIAEIDLDTLDITVIYTSSSNDIPLYIESEGYNKGAFIWYNLIDTSGQRNFGIETADDHITYVVFIDPAEPSFSITSYPTSISGKPSETKTLTIVVENQGNEGTVELRIKDHDGNVVASQQQTIGAGQSYTFNISITLPSQAGNYTWTIEAYNTDTGSIDDSKTFTVEVSSTITTTTKKKSEFPWWILLLIGIGAVMYLSGKEKKK